MFLNVIRFPSEDYGISVPDLSYALTRIKPYHERTLEELEENLKNVSRNFAVDDAYFLFEENGHRLNITLYNKGEQYVEDGEIHVHIPKVDGLLVAPRVTEEPNHNPYSICLPQDRSKYPTVTKSEKYVIIEEFVGDIKHHLPILAFEEPVRIFFDSTLQGEFIEIKCELFGKNLKKPITKALKVYLAAPTQADDNDILS